MRILADISDRASLRAILLNLVARHFNVDNEVVTTRTRIFVELSDSGFGSLELTMALEDAFDLEIPDAAQAELHTVDDVTDYMAGRLGLVPAIASVCF